MTYNQLAKVSLGLVYLVIIAGAVVRMTGSGMGCPDWPKCFGYYIPPTEKEDLEWQPGREYKRGQVIIWNESLLVATEDFTTNSTFREQYWEPYPRHDYAIFNPFHTWTEFINRLLGALAGLAILVLAIVSFRFRKNRLHLTVLSCILVAAMGFQAWLGATVVFSVLEPLKITIHMLMALGIVALLLYLIHTTAEHDNRFSYDRQILTLVVGALVLTLVQVVLGTQVRQHVDEQVELLGGNTQDQWLEGIGWAFYVHRTFSIIVAALNGYLLYRIHTRKLGFEKIYWVMAIIVLEILSGTAMYYLDFPFASQPIHLVLAALLFGVQFYLVMEALNTSGKLKSL